jgi:copper chaperone
MERLRLEIRGMNCGHCVGSVRKALGGVQGVQVDDVQIGSATVRFDPAATTREAITNAIEDQGYEVAGAA